MKKYKDVPGPPKGCLMKAFSYMKPAVYFLNQTQNTRTSVSFAAAGG